MDSVGTRNPFLVFREWCHGEMGLRVFSSFTPLGKLNKAFFYFSLKTTFVILTPTPDFVYLVSKISKNVDFYFSVTSSNCTFFLRIFPLCF